MNRETCSLVDRVQEFIRTRKMTQIERDHRERGRSIVRADYYEFARSGAEKRRGLSEDQLSIIAGDIGVAAADARADYLRRGGKLRRRNGGAL